MSDASMPKDAPSLVDMERLGRDLDPVPVEVTKFAPAKYRTATEPTLGSMIEDMRKLKRDTVAAIDDMTRKLEEYRTEWTRRVG